jgi:ABC-2 type transport system permease protein
MSAIFKREFKSYFYTPVGYIVVAALYFFLGLYFSMIYSYGAPSIEVVIVSMSTVIIFVMPVITMRLMSEDRRQKVDQALLTAPVSLTSIVLGKFFAALAVFAIGFLPTIIFEIIIISHVSVNILTYIYALLGIFLLGSALIAIGMFISSTTESSVVSAIITLIVNILVLYMSSFASMVSAEWLATVFEKLAFISVFESFADSIFSIPNIIYFLSITAAFLFLCVRSLEKRRWS